LSSSESCRRRETCGSLAASCGSAAAGRNHGHDLDRQGRHPRPRRCRRLSPARWSPDRQRRRRASVSVAVSCWPPRSSPVADRGPDRTRDADALRSRQRRAAQDPPQPAHPRPGLAAAGRPRRWPTAPHRPAPRRRRSQRRASATGVITVCGTHRLRPGRPAHTHDQPPIRCATSKPTVPQGHPCSLGQPSSINRDRSVKHLLGLDRRLGCWTGERAARASGSESCGSHGRVASVARLSRARSFRSSFAAT
jgi:hypothetical protein